MRSAYKRVLSLVVVGSAALTTVGCHDGAESDEPGATPSSAAARLDLDKATIELPLDAYGMSEEERHIVDAAIQVPYFECMTGLEDLPATILEAAREELEWTPAALDWRYGYWDATVIAELGWVPIGYGGSPLGGDYDFNDPNGDKLIACVNEDEDLLRLSTISTSGNLDPEMAALTRFAMEANEKTMADPRVVELMAERDQCITQEGYSLDVESSVGGVALEPGWTEEQQLRAVIAEAECADDLDFARRVADVNAEYESEYIAENEAELLSIKQEADERVERAREILQQVGIL
jgi:hypothetical protein